MVLTPYHLNFFFHSLAKRSLCGTLGSKGLKLAIANVKKIFAGFLNY